MMSYKTFTFKNTNDNIKLVSKPMFIVNYPSPKGNGLLRY